MKKNYIENLQNKLDKLNSKYRQQIHLKIVNKTNDNKTDLEISELIFSINQILEEKGFMIKEQKITTVQYK